MIGLLMKNTILSLVGDVRIGSTEKLRIAWLASNINSYLSLP